MSDRNTPQETFRELPKQYKLVREDFTYGVKTPKSVGLPGDPQIVESNEGIGI